MAQQNDMKDLLESVYTPSIFYIPSRVLEFSPYKVEEGIKLSPLFDTLFIIRDTVGEVFYEETIHAMIIFKKELIFDNNIYKLLEIKAKEDGDAFKYLIEKYILQVQTYADCFCWLCENLVIDIPNAPRSALDNMKYQLKVTNDHLIDIKSRFCRYPLTAYKINESLSSKISSLSIPNTFKFDQTQSPAKDIQVTDNNTVISKREISLPSNNEVDKLLLETLFHIKL